MYSMKESSTKCLSGNQFLRSLDCVAFFFIILLNKCGSKTKAKICTLSKNFILDSLCYSVKRKFRNKTFLKSNLPSEEYNLYFDLK